MTGPRAIPVVPGYALERPLGRGAAAAAGVYLAREEEGLRRPVALKLFAAHERAVFEREVEALRAVEEVRRTEREVHIVQSLGAGEFAGGCFIAFELLERGSLADLVAAEGPLPCARAAALVLDAARGLARVHRAGLYHRDLKPQNLLLGSDGRVRLGDFGLARPLDGTATAAGSPAFAAPEVIAGRRDADGRRVDIYGLGATLYYLLVGEAALPGRPDVFALERASVPRPIQAVVLRAAAPDARDRYASAEELIAELESAQSVTKIPEIPRGSAAASAAPVQANANAREKAMQTSFLRYALPLALVALMLAAVNELVPEMILMFEGIHWPADWGKIVAAYHAGELHLPFPGLTVLYLDLYRMEPWLLPAAPPLAIAAYPLAAKLGRARSQALAVGLSALLAAFAALAIVVPVWAIPVNWMLGNAVAILTIAALVVAWMLWSPAPAVPDLRRAEDPVVPFLVYALPLGLALFIVGAANIVAVPNLLRQFEELNVELPFLTKLYLANRWGLAVALALAIGAYPLVARLGRNAAQALSIIVSALSLAMVVLAAFLPLMKIVNGVGK